MPQINTSGIYQIRCLVDSTIYTGQAQNIKEYYRKSVAGFDWRFA